MARAKPLSPAERRLAILEAVAPLLVRRGAMATTKEMAEAAGVAEGTLFSVFKDKADLVWAAVQHRLDPDALRLSLAAIHAEAPLEAQLRQAAQVIMAALDDLFALGMALRGRPAVGGLPSAEGPPGGGPPSRLHPPDGPSPLLHDWGRAMNEALHHLLEPHRGRLRLPPERTAAAFVGLLFASRRPFTAPEERLTMDEIVGILLEGARQRDGG